MNTAFYPTSVGKAATKEHAEPLLHFHFSGPRHLNQRNMFHKNSFPRKIQHPSATLSRNPQQINGTKKASSGVSQDIVKNYSSCFAERHDDPLYLIDEVIVDQNWGERSLMYSPCSETNKSLPRLEDRDNVGKSDPLDLIDEVMTDHNWGDRSKCSPLYEGENMERTALPDAKQSLATSQDDVRTALDHVSDEVYHVADDDTDDPLRSINEVTRDQLVAHSINEVRRDQLVVQFGRSKLTAKVPARTPKAITPNRPKKHLSFKAYSKCYGSSVSNKPKQDDLNATRYSNRSACVPSARKTDPCQKQPDFALQKHTRRERPKSWVGVASKEMALISALRECQIYGVKNVLFSGGFDQESHQQHHHPSPRQFDDVFDDPMLQGQNEVIDPLTLFESYQPIAREQVSEDRGNKESELQSDDMFGDPVMRDNDAGPFKSLQPEAVEHVGGQGTCSRNNRSSTHAVFAESMP